MKNFRHRWAVVAVALSIAASGFVSTVAAHGAPLDPTRIVTLKTHRNDDQAACGLVSLRQILPDGTVAETEYEVPAGETLVVTDISWTIAPDPTDYVVGRSARLRLSTTDANGLGSGTIYISSGVLFTDENVNSRIGATEMLATGVVVAGGMRLCAYASGSSAFGASGSHLPATTFVRGYLSRDPVTIPAGQ